MAIQAQNTVLDVTPGGIIPVVHVSQYDVDRVLTFHLLDHNGAASPASGTTAIIEGTKPDNHGFQYSATLSGDIVTVNTTQQMTAVEGQTYCKIKLIKNSQVIGTAMFILEVERAGINESTVVSDTDIPIIVAAGEHALEAEGYALGTQNGEYVESGSPYYHHNSRYYCDEAQEYASQAESSRLVQIEFSAVSSLPVTFSDYMIHEDMICTPGDIYISNPSAILSDLTVTTNEGSVTVSGTISGTTDIKLWIKAPFLLS